MSVNDAFKIDIDGILKDKAPKHYKKIPRFLIKYLKRTTHQDDINGILERNKGLEGVDFMRSLVDNEFNLTLQIKGEDNIPDDGRFVFASNHPLGGLDGICLSAKLGKKYNGKIKYLVNDVLYYIDPLKPIFVPIVCKYTLSETRGCAEGSPVSNPKLTKSADALNPLSLWY